MLARRLEELRLQLRISKKEMAERLGISVPYYSEIITKKKTGMRKIIEFSERLGIPVERLTGEQILIPLVAEVMAGVPFQFRGNGYMEFLDITHLPGITKQTALRCYALRVRGDSMIPFHKDRDILIVERNSRKKVRHGDMVVSYKKEGSFVMSLDQSDNIPKLRPLNLSRYMEAEEVNDLINLDKIVFVISS